MPKVKRRSKKQIAEAAAVVAKKADRDRLRAEKKAKWEADYPARAAQYQRDHDARIEHERKRDNQRKIQDAGVQWLMGYDTPAARFFATYVDIETKAQRELARRHKLGGDPLNITGEKVKVSKKQARERAEAERLARGERKIVIPDPDSPRQNVLVTTLAHSLRRVKMKIHQEPAAERFVSDWEAAGYSGLSSPGFDPKVDSSAQQTAGHMRAAEAQKRLRMAEKHIGERNYDICRGVLILNANASKIHALGGRDHRTVSNDIDIALNALAAFYDPIRLERDPTWKAFKRVLEQGDAVIKKLEEEVR